MSAFRTLRRPAALLAPALALAGCATPKRALDGLLPPPPDARPAVQSLVGVTFLDAGSFVLEGVGGDPSSFAVVDYEALPTAGIAGMQPLTHGAPLHLGLEGAGLLAVWGREADVEPLGEDDVDTALWLIDLSLGPYVSTSMSRTARLYAGAGVALLFGVLNVDEDAGEDLDGSSFDAGGYARAGAEILLKDGTLLGIGVRALRADLDFGGDVTGGDGDSVQVFLTFSMGSGAFFAPPAWE